VASTSLVVLTLSKFNVVESACATTGIRLAGASARTAAVSGLSSRTMGDFVEFIVVFPVIRIYGCRYGPATSETVRVLV
jgi:hypothetical protein